MLPPAFSSTPDSLEAQEFEQLLQDAILAVKSGNRPLAKRLLDQALIINSADARIWVWLSATTEDLKQRRQYLENAVAADPSNATAKRGLLLLNEKLDKRRLMPEGEGYTPQPSPAPEEGTQKTYTCPNCGARVSYDIGDIRLVCQSCGFTHKVDAQVSETHTAQPLDPMLPTMPAHRWAESQTRLTCEQCGSMVLLPAGQTADSCPYCASNRLIRSSSLVEMLDPQAIGVFKIDPQQAAKSIKDWMGKGWFAPDDLAARHSGMYLHPAYYPFWLFSGTLEVPWFCDVNVGTGKIALWEARTDSHFELFDNVLIAGIRKISPQDMHELEPFKLDELVDFSADTLAGWVAFTYDIPLADASIRARQQVIKKVQRTLSSSVEMGHQKRNFKTGPGRWSGLTYKLILLPVYIGNYPFQGKRYRLIVNGQTGKVSGKKPVDRLKAGLYIAAGMVLLVILSVIIWLVIKFLPGG